MKRAAKGFTLLEILVALVIFSVMSAMAYGGLRTMMTARDRTEAASDQLRQLQTAFLLLHQDLEQMVRRGIRNDFGDDEPALTNTAGEGYLIAFTRGGQYSPNLPLRSALRRVAYHLEEGELRRLSWPVLDRAYDSKAGEMVLLEGVEDISIRFFDKNWGSVWPPGGAQQKSNETLPRAIEIELTTEYWGNVRRLFALPQ